MIDRPPPIAAGDTDPSARSYWVARLEGDLDGLRRELAGLKAQLSEVTKMKWWPVRVLAGSSVIVVVALASFAVFFINRMDTQGSKEDMARSAVEVRLSSVDAQLRSDFQRHQVEEEHARDRMERKVDKLIDVIVEEKRPAVVRNEP